MSPLKRRFAAVLVVAGTVAFGNAGNFGAALTFAAGDSTSSPVLNANSDANETSTSAPVPNPLETATRVWTFASTNETLGTLVPNGDVELGVALSDAEKAESIARGGDGIAARIGEGGYLAFDGGVQFDDALISTEQTFYVRVKSDSVKPNYPIFSRRGDMDELAFNFFSLGDAWGFEFGTTGNNSILSCRAPLCDVRKPESAATDWVDLVARVSKAKVEFFLDGRCVDEDFVLGEPRRASVGLLFGAQYAGNGEIQTGFSGWFDCAAFWNRALTDDEIVALSGGPERADLRSRVDRGNGESLQYWLPPNQYAAGDCMPFCVDGVFHLMYLLDKNRHRSKNGFGAHQWLQATSTDLKHWTHRRFVVPIDEQSEGSICTGSVFYWDGKYYAFYANRAIGYRMPDGEVRSPFGLICVSTSDDGIRFVKSDKNPLFYLPDGYGWSTRDPSVVRDPKSGKFVMYATTNRFGKGCLACLTSDDLFDWKLEEPVYARRDGEPECSDVFEWGGTWYLLVGHTNGYYYTSDSPLGPWEEPDAPNVIMPGIVNVPKTAPWKDNRRIVCAWSRQLGFGGRVVMRELVRRADGTLGEKFVPELIPETGTPVVDAAEIAEPETRWEGLPGDLRLRATFAFDPNERDSLAGFEIELVDGKTLVVEPGRRRVRLGDFVLENVDFSTGELKLDLIVFADLIDVCVDDDRAVIDTLPQAETRTAVLRQSEPNRLTLKKLTIAPIAR